MRRGESTKRTKRIEREERMKKNKKRNYREKKELRDEETSVRGMRKGEVEEGKGIRNRKAS